LNELDAQSRLAVRLDESTGTTRSSGVGRSKARDQADGADRVPSGSRSMNLSGGLAKNEKERVKLENSVIAQWASRSSSIRTTVGNGTEDGTIVFNH
jgi:hypothetical protein